MRLYLRTFLLLTITISLLLSGCALPHESRLKITDPSDGNTFPLNQTINIKVRAHYSSVDGINQWTAYEWVMVDDGVVLSQGSAPAQQVDFQYSLSSAAEGIHYVSVRARASRPDPDFDIPNSPYRIYTDWFNSNEVCFYVGPNPPSGDFCSIRTIVQPAVAATFTPTLTPTATPITPVPIRPNPHNPGGTNPTGCAALTNQTSCNLAGCSWNPQNSSCSVNP